METWHHMNPKCGISRGVDMTRAGRNLEKLVAHLEQVLPEAGDTAVASPGYLTDKVTGSEREFDVLLTISKAHHTVHIAFEVKEWATRKVDTTGIEGFVTKTQDTDVHSAVFVSSSGFSRPALDKAARYGIKCMTLEEVLTFPWLRASALQRVVCRPVSALFRIVYENEPAAVAEAAGLGLQSQIQNRVLLDAKGNEIDWITIGSQAWNHICRSETDKIAAQPADNLVGHVRLRTGGLYVQWKDSTTQHPLSFIEVTISYNIELQQVPFNLKIYEDSMTERTVAESARSESFEALGQQVQISMVKGPDSGIQISAIFDGGDAKGKGPG